MRSIIAACLIWVMGVQGSIADGTTPEEACLFFFDVFGSGIPDHREAYARQRITQDTDFGDSFSETFGLPRYLRIVWPWGITKSGPVRPDGEFIHEDNIAFLLECIVDAIDRRVLTINLGRGHRTGEVLPISPARVDGAKREREAVSAGAYTISLGNTVMRGLY